MRNLVCCCSCDGECEKMVSDGVKIVDRAFTDGLPFLDRANSGRVGSHLDVGAERWCVTQADLRDLRAQVKDAIRSGAIRPTPQDDFDPKDDYLGPNMYTINEQFIKPRTGGTSWALTRHPEGLECDLFITHAWKEGVFEFIDKVLNSWPAGAHHAWCCILANPQNADISDLISNPSESPFALALRHAHFVLVVPNERTSIYTRLWCVYEAYLAYQQNKLILTARAPVKWEALKALPLMTPWLVIGLVVGIIRNDSHLSEDWWVDDLIKVINNGLILLTTVLSRRRVRRGCHYLGAALSAYWVFRPLEAPMMASLMVYYIMAEMDLARFIRARQEAKALEEGFEGSIAHATCTSETDLRNIRAEIGDDEHRVNDTIQVLIRAGMSTRRLRIAAEEGVDIRDAAFIEYALPVYSVLNAILFYGEIVHSRNYTALFLHCIFSILVCLFICILIDLPLDARAFAVRVQMKVFCAKVTLMWIPRILFLFRLIDRASFDFSFRIFRSILNVGMYALVISLSRAGVHRIARLPRCGPAMAQALASRGCQRCLGVGKTKYFHEPETLAGVVFAHGYAFLKDDAEVARREGSEAETDSDVADSVEEEGIDVRRCGQEEGVKYAPVIGRCDV